MNPTNENPGCTTEADAERLSDEILDRCELAAQAGSWSYRRIEDGE